MQKGLIIKQRHLNIIIVTEGLSDSMKKPKIEINKTGHIVILDQSWHILFKDKKSLRIKQLEKQLNKLLKEQGKVNTEYKGYKALKKKMMTEIVEGMTEAFDNKNEEAVSKLKRNQKYIKDINQKFSYFEKKKSELPTEIEEVNKVLLMESMNICYERLVKNKQTKSDVEKEITVLHEKTKSLVGHKQDLEDEIIKLYTYMHDVAGIEVLEQYDQIYFGGKK